MQLRYFFTILAFIIAGCSQKNSKEQKEAVTEQKENGTAETTGESKEEGQQGSNGFWEKLEMNELRDGSGMVAAVMPLPSSWKLMPANSDGISLTGPNGIKVTDFPSQSFMDNYNPALQQSYAQSGQRMRAMPGVEQLIQQDFIPWGNNRGLSFVKYYEIPEISKLDKWYSEQLYKAVPSRQEIAAIGTEWKSDNGDPYFLLIHLTVHTNQAMQNWYYSASGLEANAAHFEAARKQYIFSLANMRYNLEPIMAYNQKEAQRIGQSWAAFNQRMAQNQANFEASQRAFVNKSNAINETIMNGWRERNAAGDKQQEQVIDNIYERNNVQDPTTGQKYKVAAGANQYWMNSDGEYIGTQLHNYDPNLDKNMNEQKWRELKQVKE